MKIYIYIFAAFLVSSLIRILPLILIKKPINNVFLRSFLYYVPYVTLAVMTFPAIIETTQTPWSGLAALVICIVLSLRGASLLWVACAGSATVFLVQLFV